MTARLVLASRSASRLALFSSSGLAFASVPADLDEDAIGAPYAEPAERARALAAAKAKAVAAVHPDDVTVGSDQVGVFVDDSGTMHWLEKPTDDAHHEAMLVAMAGRVHTFFPAVAVVRAGKVVSLFHDVVRVRFFPFTTKTAAAYVATGEGKGSCGGYFSESRGRQLIARVDGHIESVLGIPMTKTLTVLRAIASADERAAWGLL
jgi:septum formation protein